MTSSAKVIWEQRVALSHNDATKSPLATMGRPKFTPKNCSFPFDDRLPI